VLGAGGFVFLVLDHDPTLAAILAAEGDLGVLAVAADALVAVPLAMQKVEGSNPFSCLVSIPVVAISPRVGEPGD
jgi:hypothetical protein